MPEIPTYNPWPRKVEDDLKEQNVKDFKVQENKYICKVGQTVCVLCTKGDSNDYQPYDRQTKLDNFEQLYLVEQDGDRLTNVKFSLKKQNWREKGYSRWNNGNFYWKITEPEIIPNTMPLHNMKNDKNPASKIIDTVSSDKEVESKIFVTRSENWSAPVQINQRLTRPQQPRRPRVVQTEIMPTVPPVQNLNEHVNDTGFDPVEASESNTDIIKQEALLMSLDTTTPPPQLSTDLVLSDIAEPKKEIQYDIERTNELRRGRFSSSSSYDSYDSSSSDSIGLSSPIAESPLMERKNSLRSISTQESETMNNEAFIESPKEVSTSSEITTDYEERLNDIIAYEKPIYKSKNGTYHVKSPKGKTQALYGYIENNDNTISFFKITDAELFFKNGYDKNGIVLKETNGFTRTKEMKETDTIVHIKDTTTSEEGSVKSIFSGYETAKLIPQPGTEKASKSTMAEIKPVDGSVNAYATNAELSPTSPQDEPETRRGCFNFFKRRNRGGRS